MSQRTWVFLVMVFLLGAAFNFVPYTDSLPEYARRSPANGGNPFQPQVPVLEYRFAFAPHLLTPEQQRDITQLAVYGFGSRGEVILSTTLPVKGTLPSLQYRFTTRLDAITVLFVDGQGQRLGRTSLVIPAVAPNCVWYFRKITPRINPQNIQD